MRFKELVFYLRNRKKGITKEFTKYLYEQEIGKELIPIINKSSNFSEIKEKIKKKILEDSLEFVDFNLLSSLNYGIFSNTKTTFINKKMSLLYLNNIISIEEQKEIINKYQELIFDYINSNNDLKNQFYKGDIVNDLSKDILKEDISNIIEKLFLSNNNFSHSILNNIYLLKKIVFEMEILYSKDILLNNFEFVKFEMENGYFRKYITKLKNNEAIKTIEERLTIFQQSKNLSSYQIELLNNKDLLLERLKKMSFEGKKEIITKLEEAIKNNDTSELLEILEEYDMFYEIEFRNEIIQSLYTPSNSCLITDYRDVKPIMIHAFLRDPYKFFQQYMNKYKENLISLRKSSINNQDLTEEENKKYQRHFEYAKKYLFNQTYVPKTAEFESQYSDSNGFNYYKSDTSNQISTSIFDLSSILKNVGSYGIGFDSRTLSPENIAVSSANYLTTNKGLYNLEINPNNVFALTKAPIKELLQEEKNEVLLFRKGINSETKAAYVYAIISGIEEDYYLKKDEEILEKASQIAKENNLKLVVFNVYKIKESYEKVSLLEKEEIKNKI